MRGWHAGVALISVLCGACSVFVGDDESGDGSVSEPAISVDFGAQGAQNSDEVRWNHQTGPDAALLIVAVVRPVDQTTTQTVTYGGQPLTRLLDRPSERVTIEVFTLADPTPGEAQIEATFSTGDHAIGGSVTINSDGQVAVVDSDSRESQDRQPQVSVGTEPGDLVLGVLGFLSGEIGFQDPTGDKVWEAQFSNESGVSSYCSSQEAAGASTDIEFTLDAVTQWAVVGLALRPE